MAMKQKYSMVNVKLNEILQMKIRQLIILILNMKVSKLNLTRGMYRSQPKRITTKDPGKT